MKKIKKLLLLTLSLAMSATMFAACVESDNTSSSSAPTQSEETGSSVEVESSEEESSEETPCEHTGGTATCTKQAVCDVCGESYGELLEHSYTELKYDATNHWNECTCGAKDGETAHTAETKFDATNHWTECECGYVSEAVAHTAETKFDATNHWTECECGYATETVAHTMETKFDATNHWTECECGYTTETVAHTMETKFDATNHWTECECGYVTEAVAHTGGTATCAKQAECEVCGQAYGNLLQHSYTEPKFDKTNHWNECTCGAKDGETAHTLVTKNDETNHWTVCECGYVSEKVAHKAETKFDETNHWTVCECGYATEASAHSYTDDYDNTCDCGYKREIVMEVDDVVKFSVDDGMFEVPASIRGTVTGVAVEGVSIFTGVEGNVVKFNKEAFAKEYGAHGLGKNMTITTESVKFVLTADVITKVITTAKELQALGVGGGVKGDHSSYTDEGVLYGNGNSGAAGADIAGYYVLGGNIDCSDVVFAAGYSIGKHYFKGMIDGEGYTLSNVTVAEGGIFGGMYGATITNVNFENVSYLATYPSGTQGYNNNKMYGQYFGLFAHSATNLTVSNVNVQISVVKYANLDEVGLFVDRLHSGTFKNINVDASGCTFKTLISRNHSEANVYENVAIIAAGYDAIAYDKANAALTEFPAGVTFERAYSITDGKGVAKPLYEGDVTALGFPAGTKVYVHTAPAATAGTIWSVMGDKSNQVLLHKAADEDYASIQFVLGRDFTDASTSVFFAWINAMVNGTKTYAAGGWLYQNGSTGASTEEKFNAKENGYKYRVFDENKGAYVSESNPIKAGVVYTLQVYCPKLIDVELATYAISGQPMTIYFANIDSGNDVELEEVKLDTVVDVNVASGSFTVPTEVEGDVTQVIIGGIVSKNIEGNKVFLPEAFADKTSHGAGLDMVICTEKYAYTCKANVITKVITTAEELKALGVGNNRTNTEHILGYYVLGNDITFEHASDYSDVVTAGYPANDKYYFKATFDGRGYTLYNMRVSDGGIFGLMSGATVKNLNLKNVYLTDDIPVGISEQNGGYMAIFAYAAPSSVFENINITIVSSPNAWSWKRDGLLVNTSSWGSATYRDITVDATGLKLKTILGNSHSANNVYENVVITAADYVAIGYTADSYNGGVQNTAALMSEFPQGVTFNAVGKAFYNDNSDLPLYEGDVTAIGFEKGTAVRTATITDGWNSRAIVSTSTKYDYVDIEFVIGEGHNVGSLCVWDGVDGNYNVTPAGGAALNGAAERTIQVLDVNGNAITAFAANTRYILRVYTENVTNLQVSTFDCSADSPAILYFGNVTYGNAAN